MGSDLKESKIKKKQEAQQLKKQLKQQAKQREKELAKIHKIEMRALRENWYKLDNSAMIYPAIGSSHFNSVFRISAELKQNINPQILQRYFFINISFSIYFEYNTNQTKKT